MAASSSGRRKRAGRPLRSPGLVFDDVVQGAEPAG